MNLTLQNMACSKAPKAHGASPTQVHICDAGHVVLEMLDSAQRKSQGPRRAPPVLRGTIAGDRESAAPAGFRITRSSSRRPARHHRFAALMSFLKDGDSVKLEPWRARAFPASAIWP